MADKTLNTELYKMQCQINALKESVREKLGNTLMVSKEGSDGIASGDDHLPFKTITGAVAKAEAGDTIIVYPGTYTVGEIGSGADMENDGQGTINLKNGVNIHFMNGVTIENINTVYGTAFAFQYVPSDGEVVDIKITGHLNFKGGPSGSTLFFLNTNDAFDVHYNFFAEISSAEILDYYGAVVACRAKTGNIKLIAKYVKLATIVVGRANQIFAQNMNDGLGGTATINAAIEINQVEFADTVAGGDNRAVLLLRNMENSNVSIKIGNVFGVAFGSGLMLSYTGFSGTHINNSIKYDIGNLRLLNPRVVDATHTGFSYDATTEMSGNGADAQNRMSSLIFVYNQNALGDWRENRIDMNIGNISGHTGASVYFNLRNENVTANNIFSLVVDNIEVEDDYPAVSFDTRNGGGANLGSYSIRVHNLARSTSVPIRSSRYGTDTHQVELIGRFASVDLTNPAIEFHENWTNPIVLRDAILLTTATNSIVRRSGAAGLNAVVYGSYANTAPAAFLTQLVETITVDVNAV